MIDRTEADRIIAAESRPRFGYPISASSSLLQAQGEAAAVDRPRDRLLIARIIKRKRAAEAERERTRARAHGRRALTAERLHLPA